MVRAFPMLYREESSMRGRRTDFGLCVTVVLGLSFAACSSLENPVVEPRRTVAVETVLPVTPFDSGVEGHIWIGPTCPVVRIGNECPDRPYETEFSITTL